MTQKNCLIFTARTPHARRSLGSETLRGISCREVPLHALLSALLEASGAGTSLLLVPRPPPRPLAGGGPLAASASLHAELGPGPGLGMGVGFMGGLGLLGRSSVLKSRLTSSSSTPKADAVPSPVRPTKHASRCSSLASNRSASSCRNHHTHRTAE